MKNKDFIVLLVDKSTNVFGQVIGLSADAKLRITINIIQETINDCFGINTHSLNSQSLAKILTKNTLDLYQSRLIAYLIWTQAEMLLKLNEPEAGLKHFKNALQLLQWQTQQAPEKSYLESKNKILKLEKIIANLDSPRKKKHK